MAEWGTDVIFCGNAGVGKTTLLKSLLGARTPHVASTRLVEVTRGPPGGPWEGVRLLDTPGLTVPSTFGPVCRALGAELRDAAVRKRLVKLFFVVAAEGGRVRAEDKFAVSHVMAAITLPGGSPPGRNSYGLLVNRCACLEDSRFLAGGRAKLELEVGASSLSLKFPTTWVHFLPEVDCLASGSPPSSSGFTFQFPRLAEFVQGFPGIVDIEAVAVMGTDHLEERLAVSRMMDERELAALASKLTGEDQAGLAQLGAEIGLARREARAQLATRQAQGPAAPTGKAEDGGQGAPAWAGGPAAPPSGALRMDVRPGTQELFHDFPAAHRGSPACPVESVRVEAGGLIYGMRVTVAVSRGCQLRITDGEPDTYKLRCFRAGEHYVDYNSRDPTIKTVEWDIL